MNLSINEKQRVVSVCHNRLNRFHMKSFFRISEQTAEGVDETVSFSDFKKELLYLNELAASLQDPHSLMVKNIKMEIERGDYAIQGNKIASSMLRNAFENNLILNRMVAYA